MCWITEDKDFVSAGVLQKAPCIVGVVAINEQQPVAAICLLFGMFIELLDPFNSDNSICPSFLGVSESVCYSKLVYSYHVNRSTHAASAGLSCFQDT